MGESKIERNADIWHRRWHLCLGEVTRPYPMIDDGGIEKGTLTHVSKVPHVLLAHVLLATHVLQVVEGSHIPRRGCLLEQLLNNTKVNSSPKGG